MRNITLRNQHWKLLFQRLRNGYHEYPFKSI